MGVQRLESSDDLTLRSCNFHDLGMKNSNLAKYYNETPKLRYFWNEFHTYKTL